MSKLAIAARLALAGALLLVTTAFAHAFLKHSSPAAGATLTVAPQEVRLEFTETLEPSFSQMTVSNEAGQDVTQGKPQVSGAIMLVALLPLEPGIYDVRWRALSVDTHETQGAYRFKLR